MKIKLYILISLLPFISNAQTLLDTSKTWSVLECITSGWGYCSTTYYRVSGDTVINSVSYKFLMTKADSSANTAWYNRYIVREDSVAKKVFINVAGQEYLLYDFSLNTGDTVNAVGAYGNTSCQAMLVDSVDMVNISGVQRKRLLLSMPGVAHGGPYYDEWIEGIGNITGIIHNFILLCSFDMDATLLCVDSAAQNIYQTPLYNSCYLILSNGELKSKTSVSVYPTILNDRLHINKNGIDGKILVTLFDPSGKIILEKNIENEQSEITLPTLSEGMYFCRLSGKNYNSVVKLISLSSR
jgi:hypothetical protein